MSFGLLAGHKKRAKKPAKFRKWNITINNPKDKGLDHDATVHGIHATLHQALKVAKEQGFIPTNPADEVEPPKVMQQPIKILNKDRLDAFMNVIADDDICYDFFYTELTTGLRRG